jgi:hypothetical protein
VKRIAIILVSIVAVFGALLFWLVHSSGPPKEANLIQNFNAHRASFERLRDMLESDTQIRRLADWGVETDKGMFKPPAGNFPIDRYNEYLALLKESDGKGAGREEGARANPTVLLWASGFGGDIAHVGISWMDEVPSRQVGSLDQYYRDHKAPVGSGWVCQHIDGNWYLWTDLWTR